MISRHWRQTQKVNLKGQRNLDNICQVSYFDGKMGRHKKCCQNNKMEMIFQEMKSLFANCEGSPGVASNSFMPVSIGWIGRVETEHKYAGIAVCVKPKQT